MNGEKAYPRNGNGNKWNPVVIGIVSAVLGSGGAISLVFGTPIGQNIARPDPFTGSQGAALVERVDNIESEIESHIHNHPSDVNRFDRRITTLEVQYASILSNQQKIIDRLDRMAVR